MFVDRVFDRITILTLILTGLTGEPRNRVFLRNTSLHTVNSVKNQVSGLGVRPGLMNSSRFVKIRLISQAPASTRNDRQH